MEASLLSARKMLSTCPLPTARLLILGHLALGAFRTILVAAFLAHAVPNRLLLLKTKTETERGEERRREKRKRRKGGERGERKERRQANSPPELNSPSAARAYEI